VRSLLNGGAAEAGVEGLQAAVDAVAAEIAGYRNELALIPSQRGDAALADDAPAAFAKLSARENELLNAIGAAQYRLGRLHEKLVEQTDLRRNDRIAFHQAENRETFEKLDAAVSAAVAANLEARRVYENAARELGGGDAARLIQPLHFGGLLLPDALETWRTFMRAALYPSKPQAKPANLPLKQTASGQPGSIGQIASLQRPVRLHQPQERPPAKPVRPLYNEEAKRGEQRVRILRNGYEAPDGRACRIDDVIALPTATAGRVVLNGAGEFEEQP
jgi:hypothetical protein